MANNILKVIFLSVGLSACASAEDRYAQQCYNYGYAPGTEAFVGCMNMVAQSDLYRRQMLLNYSSQMLNGY